ncbi:hypothetical protein [Streptomyces capitiformicae]|uniref:Uncharacterized protein n=1 Tax=Streptomyces capitiformicae TaxID=2014920 RepID=A0A919GFP8_9ACTN|nr:hypothetical protein [Streptomyces capitiformicae]GHH83010.1 hypothetical protein GCM10017771_08750 [Streptomyces capitiformicae]
MNKLKKAAAVTFMVGGMALGGGVAHGDDDTQAIGNVCAVSPSGAVAGNLQALRCNQDFDAGAAFVPGGTVG